MKSNEVETPTDNKLLDKLICAKLASAGEIAVAFSLRQGLRAIQIHDGSSNATMGLHVHRESSSQKAWNRHQ
jgi:hypothetical protein